MQHFSTQEVSPLICRYCLSHLEKGLLIHTMQQCPTNTRCPWQETEMLVSRTNSSSAGNVTHQSKEEILWKVCCAACSCFSVPISGLWSQLGWGVGTNQSGKTKAWDNSHITLFATELGTILCNCKTGPLLCPSEPARHPGNKTETDVIPTHLVHQLVVEVRDLQVSQAVLRLGDVPWHQVLLEKEVHLQGQTGKSCWLVGWLQRFLCAERMKPSWNEARPVNQDPGAVFSPLVPGMSFFMLSRWREQKNQKKPHISDSQMESGRLILLQPKWVNYMKI